jgi:hypothetical protein
MIDAQGAFPRKGAERSASEKDNPLVKVLQELALQ